MARGKQKGSAFEREFCKTLSHWWSGGGRSDCFWRTASSGGRATARRKKGLATANSAGDICSTDECGLPFLRAFALELKRGYNGATIADTLDRPAKAAAQTYEKWVAQAKESQLQSGSKYWMVVHKRDKRDAVVLMSRVACTALCLIARVSDLPKLELFVGEASYTLLRLDVFLNHFSPDDIKRL
jgi:hypothetical protein